MRDLSELYLRGCGPPPAAETVQAFEAHFEVSLPADYLRFLSLANGGEPMLDCTFHYTTPAGLFVEDADQVKEFASLTGNSESIGGVWRDTQFLWDLFAGLGRDTNVVYIGWTGEGDTLYLDCATEPPCVRVLYRDFDNMAALIAGSFDDFLDSLHPRR